MTQVQPSFSRPYRERPIRFLGVWQREGWRLKVYGISARRERPDERLVDAAKLLAARELPLPAVAADRYGVGALIVHEGNDGHFVLLDYWTGENMLHHQVFFSPLGDSLRLESFAHTGIAVCVWELHVLAFERQAWIDTVMRRPGAPDFNAYLARQLEADV